MKPTEGELPAEQRGCCKCKEPCCLGDFKQVADLKSSGLLIYVPKDAEGAIKGKEQKPQGCFILHNDSDKELKRPDYIKEMCQYKTKCTQCKEFIHRVRNLLDEVTDIKQNEVIGVCKHCKRLNPSGNCKRCEYFVNKFKCCQVTQKQEKHERFLSWLQKVSSLLQNILECKNVCTNRLYDEQSHYLTELVQLLQELKPPIDEQRPDLNLLSKVMQSANDANIIQMLEELLLKMKYDTSLSMLPRMLKSAYDSKIRRSMEYEQSTIMGSLAMNKEKLEELLLKIKHDIDLKLLSKMLKYAGSIQGKMEFGRSISVESLAKKKVILEKLLLKMKYDTMRARSLDNIYDKDISSREISPDLKMQIAKLTPEKENVSKKFIRVMSQKVDGKDEIKSDRISDRIKSKVMITKKRDRKGSVPVYKNKKKIQKQALKKLKPDLSKRKQGKKRDSFDTDSLEVSDGTRDKEELKRKKGKRHGSKDSAELYPVTGDIKKEFDKKHGSMYTKDVSKTRRARRLSITYSSAKDIKTENLAAKNKQRSNSSEGQKPSVNVQKDSPKMIKGTKLVHLHSEIEEQATVKPILYKQEEFQDIDQPDLPQIYPSVFDISAVEDRKEKRPRRSRLLSYDETRKHGGFLYQLSNQEYIKKGWTIMPKTKTLRKIRIYKMEPALPQYDWFENNKKKKNIFYDSGEKLAEIDDDGQGQWFYKNGEVALDYYNSEDEGGLAGQRYVIYSRSDDLDMGKMSPRTVLASFDNYGNGVVYDRYGNQRLKYNQFEGALLDKNIGPLGRWKWHSLNEPPELHEINVENYVKRIDPGFEEIFKNVNSEDNPRKPRKRVSDPEMLAIENANYAKYEANKLSQKFMPFKIRMKALKMNDNFSLRVLDQANIHVLFREGPTKLKLNVGMILINELIETETIDTDDVVTPYDQLPPLSQSLENIQEKVGKARRFAKMDAEKTERLLRPPKLSRSAYKVGIGLKELGNCAVQHQFQYPAFQMTRKSHD